MTSYLIVLEPCNHVYKVIERAHDEGLQVIVFHTLPMRTEGAYLPGFNAISERVQLDSWADQRKAFEDILSVVGTRHIVGTYAAHESTLVIDALLREHFDLPTAGPARVADLLNKRKVRAELNAAGLSALRSSDPRQAVATRIWPFPGKNGFLKPICGGGSAYVTRCSDCDSLEAGLGAWDKKEIACRAILQVHLERGGDLFLEEEAVGELLSVEGFVYDGEYSLLGLTSRTVLARDRAVEMGATFPYFHPHHEAIVRRVRDIHRALGFTFGATHAEVVVSGAGEVELVELNIRFGGADIILLMGMALSLAPEAVLVDLACGRRPRAPSGSAAKFACMQQVLPPLGSRLFESIDFPDKRAVERRVLKPLGSTLASSRNQTDQVGSYIVVGDSYHGALEAASSVRSAIRFNGNIIGDDPNNVVVLR